MNKPISLAAATLLLAATLAACGSAAETAPADIGGGLGTHQSAPTHVPDGCSRYQVCIR